MKALALLLCSLAALGTQAADWRQWRGPNGTGIAADAVLPEKLGTNNIAWRAALPGRGISSPIIVGERVFITCSSGGQQDRLHVICLSAKSGTVLWERQFWATGRTTCHEKISVAAPTGASDGERFFALFSSNDLFCLDLDGNLLWLRGLMRDYPNASNGLGLATSLVVADGVVIAQVETDGEAFAAGIDIATGLNRWRHARPKGANWTTPIVARGESGKEQVLLQGRGGLSAIDPGTGAPVWQFTGGASTVPSSALRGELLIVPSGGITALQLIDQGQSFKELWRAAPLRTGTATPLAMDDRIFILNDLGILTCAAIADGKRLWQSRLAGPFTASPVVAGRFLCLVNEKGAVQIVDGSSADGAILSTLELGETILATPSIAGNALYLRSDSSIWKIEAR